MDFSGIRKQVLERVQQTNRCRSLSVVEQTRLKLNSFVDVWSVTVELSLPSGEVSSVIMHLGFPYEFPLAIPSVFLSKSDRDRLGYLPHINARGSICTYDAETTVLNYDAPDAPYQIVRQCILDAKRLIERELKTLPEADFQTEFVAYWEGKYHPKDQVEVGLTLLTDDVLPGTLLDFTWLREPIGGFRFVLYNANPDAHQFREYLTETQNIRTEQQAYYWGDVPTLKPPFYWTNRQVMLLIRQHAPEQVERFISYLDRAEAPTGIFSTCVGDKKLYFGWRHPSISRRNGFRATISPSEAIQTFAQLESVIRIKFDTFSQQRLSLRTDGQTVSQSFRFTIVGLGSVGSNLVGLLKSLPVAEFHLVDTDVLSLENINRHLLGLTYLGLNKTVALRDFLRGQNPLCPVRIQTESIVKVLAEDPECIGETDAVFLAIGKTVIEQYVITFVMNKPVGLSIFILWVEPYAIGCHMVYIPAGSRIDYAALFPGSYYQHNAVAASQYASRSNRLLMKEAGCQTTYVPYGQEFVTLFLSQMLPHIRRLLYQPEPDALAFTWLGNREAAKQRGLDLSDFALAHACDELVITILH